MTKLLGDKLLMGEPLLGYISIATFLGDMDAMGKVSMVTWRGDILPDGSVSNVMVLLGDGDFLEGLVSTDMGEYPRGGIPTVTGLILSTVMVVGLFGAALSRGCVSMCTTFTIVLGGFWVDCGELGVFGGVEV